ncbi:MAG: histidine phosphatase family protein [Propionibacteriaceae bacterium]|jgi:probable phosphoglycerate mutase|nr:histidine phosphatase family protein [Propionibacteriaceae bacterium]
MRIIFIRHGQTDSNTGHLLDTGFPGAPLNDIGLAQAAGLPARLANEPIQAVMTSDITRARQTGQPLADSRGLDMVTDPGVREIYAGDWDMRPDWGDYINVITSWHTDLSRSMPHGDSGTGFFERFDAAVASLVQYDCAAVVSHGGALRTWLAVRGGLQLDDDPRWMLSNTDTVVVDGAPGRWKVLRWADQVMA